MFNKLDGEKVIIFHLLKNSAYFYRVFSKLNKDVFKKQETQIIYEYINKYYKKFEKKPSFKELALFIINSTLSKVIKDKIIKYFKEELAQEKEIENFDFLIDFTEKYLKKVALTDAILESVEIIKKQDDLDGVDIITKFENALDFKFDTDLGMELLNLEKKFKHYKEKFSNIPTGIKAIDEILGGGFRPKTLSIILSPSHGGKCLGFSTKLNIYMDNETLKRYKEWKLKKRNKINELTNKVTMLIGELFEFNEFFEDVKEDTFKKPKYNVYIESPNGIVPIRHLVKKLPEDWVNVTLENGKSVKVSLNHKFVVDNEIIFAKDLKENDYLETKEGLKKIVSIERIENKNEYLYGLSLDEPHLYYDANGILHHNTAMMCAISAGFTKQKKNGLYVTLEMPEVDILKRVDANILDTPIYKFDEMTWEEYKQKYDSMKNYLGRMFVKEYPAGSFSTFDLEKLKYDIEQENNLKLDYIIIDYMGLMKSTRVKLSQGSYLYFKSISEELHGFAKKHNIPIISSFQMNRGAYNNLEAGMESISDSMGVIMTADVSMLLLSNEQLKEQKQVMLKTEKNRYTGKLDKILLEVDWPKMKFKGVDEAEDIIQDLNNTFGSDINTEINNNFDSTIDSNTNAINTSSMDIDDEFEFE